HCEWLSLGCIVVENGVPRTDGNGVSETRQFLLHPSQVEIADTWRTTGLRGTGSHDVVGHDAFVEDARSFSFRDPKLIKRAGPRDAFPFMFIAKGSAPALGIARHAIDTLAAGAAGKPARRYTLGERPEPPGRRPTAVRKANRLIHQPLSARRRRLRRCRA